ncbi:MAG TPA: hypothetical protein PLF40_32470, partial [Kofleriaceae bacterium]|nr:hypothetical protein [Kofleriaceae bacterium]
MAGTMLWLRKVKRASTMLSRKVETDCAQDKWNAENATLIATIASGRGQRCAKLRSQNPRNHSSSHIAGTRPTASRLVSQGGSSAMAFIAGFSSGSAT